MTITPKKTSCLSIKQKAKATPEGQEVLKRVKEVSGDHQIAVGLSGGVDSSLTAALLVEAGWKVEGITLWLMSGKGSCCTDGIIDAAGGKVLDAAKLISDLLGINSVSYKQLTLKTISSV